MRRRDVPERTVQCRSRGGREREAVARQHYCQLTSERTQGRADDGIKYWLDACGRAADDPQDISSGGLAAHSRLGLIEQPRVLDGDDGLVGEGLEQLDVVL